MTLDRYKFLEALWALRDAFTLNDILSLTKLPKGTAATFLNRETRFIERCGTVQTKHRGGQVAQYRVKPQAVFELKQNLDGIRKVHPFHIKTRDRVLHLIQNQILENQGNSEVLKVLTLLRSEVKKIYS